MEGFGTAGSFVQRPLPSARCFPIQTPSTEREAGFSHRWLSNECLEDLWGFGSRGAGKSKFVCLTHVDLFLVAWDYRSYAHTVGR